MATTRKRRGRARRGTGSVGQRGEQFMAQIDLGTRPDGSWARRTRSFDTRDEAETWLLEVRQNAEELTASVADQSLATYLRWWIEEEAPKGKPGRAPLAESTVRGYRSNIEKHLIPALGSRKVGELTVAELDRFANSKLKEGLAPTTVNRFRETLRSALSTAVRQDRLLTTSPGTAAASASSRRPSTGSPTTSSPGSSRPRGTSASIR
ncbi:MAG TPA: hypothetical protein VHF25_07805 [Nitriliruptorales bacterium]|nr:hypothetical protein [Nitriliruptorales bacterium]